MSAVLWIEVKIEMPDADQTVLIHDETADEPVWLGYFDGEAWRFVDGEKASPSHWAEMPEPPAGNVQDLTTPTAPKP